MTRIGAGSIHMDFANVGPDGTPPVLFDNATYVSHGYHGLQYWFRPLVYFHVGWDRKQLITVPEKSIYAERNLYCFFGVDNGRPDAIVKLADAVQARPSVQIGPYPLPPSR